MRERMRSAWLAALGPRLPWHASPGPAPQRGQATSRTAERSRTRGSTRVVRTGPDRFAAAARWRWRGGRGRRAFGPDEPLTPLWAGSTSARSERYAADRTTPRRLFAGGRGPSEHDEAPASRGLSAAGSSLPGARHTCTDRGLAVGGPSVVFGRVELDALDERPGRTLWAQAGGPRADRLGMRYFIVCLAYAASSVGLAWVGSGALI